MIDWLGLAANALWILGLSLALATLSYTYWQASISSKRLRHVLQQPAAQIALDIAGVFFCLGLAGSSQTWEQILWLVLGAAFTFQGTTALVSYFRARS